jgi:hypothetical protein
MDVLVAESPMRGQIYNIRGLIGQYIECTTLLTNNNVENPTRYVDNFLYQRIR